MLNIDSLKETQLYEALHAGYMDCHEGKMKAVREVLNGSAGQEGQGDYDVFVTMHANEDLVSVLEEGRYAEQMKEVEKNILNLDVFPTRHKLWEDSMWADKGIRIMPCEDFMVFYSVDEENMKANIVRVMYRDMEEETDWDEDEEDDTISQDKEYKYERTIYWSRIDHCYIVEIPELKGCFAEGNTIENAVTNSNEAIAKWIEREREAGNEIPLDEGREY